MHSFLVIKKDLGKIMYRDSRSWSSSGPRLGETVATTDTSSSYKPITSASVYHPLTRSGVDDTVALLTSTSIPSSLHGDASTSGPYVGSGDFVTNQTYVPDLFIVSAIYLAIVICIFPTCSNIAKHFCHTDKDDLPITLRCAPGNTSHQCGR